jgi:hypothetical protein
MMRRFKLTLPAAAILAALSVSTTGATAQSDGDRQSRPEPVMSFRADGHELVFRVPTGGCTTVTDFQVGVQRSGRDVSLSLARQRPDTCKGWFPAGIELTIPYQDVGLQTADRIRLVNRVAQADPAR